MSEKKQKVMKVPRGTARRIRRAVLVRDWKNIPTAKKMLPPVQKN